MHETWNLSVRLDPIVRFLHVRAVGSRGCCEVSQEHSASSTVSPKAGGLQIVICAIASLRQVCVTLHATEADVVVKMMRSFCVLE